MKTSNDLQDLTRSSPEQSERRPGRRKLVKFPSRRPTALSHLVILQVILLTLTSVLVQAYEFTINRHEQHRPTSDGPLRTLTLAGPPYFPAVPTSAAGRLDQDQAADFVVAQQAGQAQQNAESSEDQELRQLHQVVDTMAHLLSQEEAAEARRLRDQLGTAARRQDNQPTSEDVVLARPYDPFGQIQEASSEEQPVAVALPLDPEEKQQHSSSPRRRREQQQATQTVVGPRELVPTEAESMSESAIRQAIAQLELVQQEERQRQQATAQFNNNNADEQRPDSQRSRAASAGNLESLIDELDEELLDDQIAAASQDAERLLVQSQRTNENIAKKDQKSQVDNNQEASKSDASVVTVPLSQRPEMSIGVGGPKQPMSEIVVNNDESSAKSSASSSLMVGQLESAGADSVDTLGSALTSDFYSFHADSIGAQAATGLGGGSSTTTLAATSSQTPASQSPSQTTTTTATSSAPSSSSSGEQSVKSDRREAASDSVSSSSSRVADLDSAAQTRNSQRQDFDTNQPFDQSQPSSLDFSQLVAPPPQHLIAASGQLDQDQLVAGQAFRSQQQQQGNQFPGSTIVPLQADNFWHPSSGVNPQQSQQQQQQQQQQQFNRAFQEATSLPPLPPARFQNLASPAPFLQTFGNQQQQRGQQARPSSQPTPQHFHFSGHGLIETNPFQTPNSISSSSSSSNSNENQAQADQRFNATPQPMISVISGSEPVGSNSVSWNPPAAINPLTPSSFQQSAFQPTFAPAGTPTTASSPSPFRNAFTNQQVEPTRGQFGQSGQTSFRPQLLEDGRNNKNNQDQGSFFQPETALTEAPLELPPSTQPIGAVRQNWQSVSRPPNSSLGPVSSSTSSSVSAERDAADSKPRASTVRSFLPDDARRLQFSDGDQDLRGPPSQQPRASSPPAPNRPLPAFPSTELPPPNFSLGPSTTTTTTQGTTTRAVTSMNNSQPATTLAPGSSTSAAPAPNSTVTSSNKKDDTVIYYYYYYDDNNNATVVAKNISASAAANINGATLAGATGTNDLSGLEVDSGLEDTPYMEDAVQSPPAPQLAAAKPATGFQTNNANTFNNLQPALNADQPSPTRGTSSFSSSPSGGPSFRPVSADTPKARPTQQPVAPSQPKEFRVESNNRLPSESESDDSDYEQPQSDQQRPPIASSPAPPPTSSFSSSRATGTNNINVASRPRPLPEAIQTSPVKPAPPPPPQRSSQNSAALAQPVDSRQSSQATHSNQFGQSTNTRGQQQGGRLNEAPTPSRGVPNHQAQAGPSRHSVGSTQSQQVPQANRAAANLSNASRYGTSTSNQFLEPYGLEPAAGQPPVGPTAHHSHSASQPEVHSRHHSHHQQPPAAGKPERTDHQQRESQPSRRPNSSSLADSVLASTGARPAAPSVSNGAPEPTSRLSTGQHFSPQRNQQVAPAPQPPQQQPARQQTQEPQPARTRQQFYPESKPQSFASRLPAGGSSRLPTSGQPPTTSPAAGATPESELEVAPGGTRESDEPVLNKLEPGTRAANEPQRLNGQSNGRPAGPDGTAANGFTRAPPTAGQQRGAAQRANQIESSDSSSGSSSSGLKPFGQPLQHVQFSTSMSPPTSSISVSRQTTSSAAQSPTVPATFSTSSTSSSTNQQPQTTPAISMISSTTQAATSTSFSTTTTTTVSSTTTSTTTTTPAPSSQDTASSQATTESSDSQSASTRRKFGNRNNRFQTRLSAIRANGPSSPSPGSTQAPTGSTTTTTTTTRRPTVSTTRKTSKQLFSGRRRLGSSTSTTTGGDSGSQVSGVSSGAISTEAPPPASSSSRPSSGQSISASRARFGSNFPLRSRSSTTSTTTTTTTGTPQTSLRADSTSTTAQSGGSSSNKPAASLFSTPRAVTFKPRLPFLKSSSPKPANSDGASPSASEQNQTTSLSSVSSNQDSSETESTGAGPTNSVQPNGNSESEPIATISDQTKPESAASDQTTATTSATITLNSSVQPVVSSSPAPPSAKPKRPLFASRQRSASLFGNRRSNEQTAAAA